MELQIPYKGLISPVMYDLKKEENPDKHILNNDKEKQCIFCYRKKPEVSFRKDAHIFPASLSNQTWFNRNECDSCNEDYFSVFENDLCNFLMLDRIFLGAPKRKGYAKFKSHSKDHSYMERQGQDEEMKIQIDDLEGRFSVEEKENSNEIVLHINNPLKYNLVRICKALAHMGISFLSEDYRNTHKHLNEWLLNNIEIFPLYLDVCYVPGNGYRKSIFEVREALNSDNDYSLVFRYTFGLHILTFYVPKSPDVDSSPIRDYIYVQPFPKDQGQITPHVLNKDTEIVPDYQNYTLGYNSTETFVVKDE